jgi:Autotransporter adhesin
MKAAPNNLIYLAISSIIFTCSVNAAPAAYDQSWADTVEAQAQGARNQALYATDQAIDAQNTANRNASDITIIENGLMNLDSAVTNNQQDIAQLKGNAQKTFQEMQTINDKNDNQDKQLSQISGGVQKNYQDIQNLSDQNNKQDKNIYDNTMRINALENAPKPKDGINGKDGTNGKDGIDGKNGANGKDGSNGKDGHNGKDGTKGDKGDSITGATGKAGHDGRNGVTTVKTYNTTTVKHEVDQATRKAVNQLQQTQAKQNSTFSSMKDSIDKNDKKAMAGVSSAIAAANLPQVQANQKFMFSAGAGTYEGESAVAVGGSVNFSEHVVGKVSFSADTQDNYGAGAGVGVGF